MLSKNLLKKTGIYAVGNLSSKIMSALLIPIYAFYISTNDLGYFDFSQTLMSVTSPIIVLAIWEAILKFVLSEDKLHIKTKMLTTAFVFSLIMSLVLILTVLIINSIFDLSIKYLGLISAMIVVHSLVYVWQYSARALERNKLFVVAGILSTIVNFILVLILIVYLRLGLLGLLLSYIFSQLSIIFFIERKISILSGLRLKNFEIKILRDMLVFSSPLVLNLISAWLISGFGRFLITVQLGNEANGLYSFSNRFSLLISMLGTVVTMAIIEEAILSAKEKRIDKEFGRTLESLFKIFQLFALVSVPIIVMFYNFISDTAYYNSLVFVPWLLLYAISNTMASNLGSAFQAISKTKYQFITTLLGAAITVVISIFLINSFGISAVIFGQLLGALTMLTSRYVLINKFISLKINWKPIVLRYIIFIVVTMICLNTAFYYNLAIAVLMVSIIAFQNKKLIKMSINKIKR
ncbi:lipopolysaccharide biosynthesis protein [Ornithinibacillus halotolerans]|uniref:Polysaccharide biosynthesis protein C-terminal domain-containing protein n=1 Tax=Ornithinibacillus halotolerans TaxID=1274357 RepID=A0A916RSC6_9BACI|nr:oligosaccharide flippase family protein [Ornithinibacillus halotolerans]GGA65151.1 hypothetical protein GCM10008025_06230 [Ornithinibacillus halotolerans]